MLIIIETHPLLLRALGVYALIPGSAADNSLNLFAVESALLAALIIYHVSMLLMGVSITFIASLKNLHALLVVHMTLAIQTSVIHHSAELYFAALLPLFATYAPLAVHHVQTLALVALCQVMMVLAFFVPILVQLAKHPCPLRNPQSS